MPQPAGVELANYWMRNTLQVILARHINGELTNEQLVVEMRKIVDVLDKLVNGEI
jgi:hypothetical protein